VSVDRERAKTQLATVRRDLAILMGDSIPRFGAAAGRLAGIGQPPPFPWSRPSRPIRNSWVGRPSPHNATPTSFWPDKVEELGGARLTRLACQNAKSRTNDFNGC